MIFAYSYSDPLFETPPEGDWGMAVAREYRDLGDRAQLQQLLRDCREHPPERVVVRRWCELGDSLESVRAVLREFEALGVRAIALHTAVGEHASEPSELREESEILQLLHEIQAQHRSRNIRRGHARNRVKALPPPGKAPFGYRRGKDKYALDRAAAAIVKDFFEHFLLYGSVRGTVRYLERKHGKKIAAATGRRWLTNPVYRGDLACRNGEVVRDTHVAIVSREEAAQVDRLLRRNRQMPSRSASAPRSLSGLVVCARCRSAATVTRVTARRATKEYLYLRPVRCPQQPKCGAIAYGEVLQRTIETVCRTLPQAVAELELPDLSAVKQRLAGAIAAKQGILAQLPDLQTTGVLDPETAELRAYKLRNEIAQLQDRLAGLPPVNLRETAIAVSIPQFWLDLSETERRFYFREFIQRIEVAFDRKGENWELHVVFIF